MRIDDSDLQQQIVCNIMYLSAQVRLFAKQTTLFDLWDCDPQLAECIEDEPREMKKPFYLEDSGGYEHVIYLEIMEEKHLETLEYETD